MLWQIMTVDLPPLNPCVGANSPAFVGPGFYDTSGHAFQDCLLRALIKNE